MGKKHGSIRALSLLLLPLAVFGGRAVLVFLPMGHAWADASGSVAKRHWRMSPEYLDLLKQQAIERKSSFAKRAEERAVQKRNHAQELEVLVQRHRTERNSFSSSDPSKEARKEFFARQRREMFEMRARQKTEREALVSSQRQGAKDLEQSQKHGREELESRLRSSKPTP